MLHTSPGTARHFSKLYDRHGDSYTEDATVSSLKDVFKSVADQVGDESPRRNAAIFSSESLVFYGEDDQVDDNVCHDDGNGGHGHGGGDGNGNGGHGHGHGGGDGDGNGNGGDGDCDGHGHNYGNDDNDDGDSHVMVIVVVMMVIVVVMMIMMMMMMMVMVIVVVVVVVVMWWYIVVIVLLFCLVFLLQNGAVSLSALDIARTELRYFPDDCPLGLLRCCRWAGRLSSNRTFTTRLPFLIVDPAKSIELYSSIQPSVHSLHSFVPPYIRSSFCPFIRIIIRPFAFICLFLWEALTLSPPRVINSKFPLQPHQKYDITQYEELYFS